MSIDLYSIYQLDRQQPPEVLAQQLDQRLSATDPGDILTRGRIETARVILGDPNRRAVYDQQLADPAAQVTEQTLAGLAGRPVPTSTLTLRGALATTQGKIVAGGAAGLVLILLLVIVVAAVSGGDKDDGEAAAATASSSSSSSGDAPSASGEVVSNDRVSRTGWDKGDSRPRFALVLTKETPLPAQFDPELIQHDPPCNSSGFSGTGAGLVQYQDRNVGYVYEVSPEGSTSTRDLRNETAVLNPQGDLESTNTYELGAGPKTFDLMKSKSSGYARVEADNGISIPAEAAGDEDDKHYATCILPDAFDDELLWVTMRGSSSVYQAQIREVGA